MLPILLLADEWRFGQSEEHDLFAAGRADVVVQAQDFDAGGSFHHRVQDRPGEFDQLGADLFQQISALFGNERLDQVLFGGGQHATQSNQQQITEQMGLDILGATAHVFLLEARDPLADCGFDFSLRFHHQFPSCPHTKL